MLFYVLMVVTIDLLIEINLINCNRMISYIFFISIIGFLNFIKEIIKFGLLIVLISGFFLEFIVFIEL